jgi:hypothetical protein
MLLFFLSPLPHLSGVPGRAGDLTEGQSCLRGGRWDNLSTLSVELVQILHGDLHSEIKQNQNKSNLYLHNEKKGNDVVRYGNSDERLAVRAYQGVPHTEQFCLVMWFICPVNLRTSPWTKCLSSALLLSLTFLSSKARIQAPKSYKPLSHS